ncbi:tubulin polyglutamylase complex subunit 2 [Platysternon megacephalum]|uniref:Tubulin polyglutamylase complex subunit 2 n=1 Tax=Platysternon megacephalum TaxID=55544 RepID=A0A4D9E6G2_9SAUR|nr:tubulin polyglutamylase complex subunit 2 [Platysternon megacephalum]
MQRTEPGKMVPLQLVEGHLACSSPVLRPAQSLSKLICARGSLQGSEGENCPLGYSPPVQPMIRSLCMASGAASLQIHWPWPSAVPFCSPNVAVYSLCDCVSKADWFCLFAHLRRPLDGSLDLSSRAQSSFKMQSCKQYSIGSSGSKHYAISRGSGTGGAEAGCLAPPQWKYCGS